MRRIVYRLVHMLISKDRMEKDKEQQRLQFNSAVENDDERRRPECSNGTISGEEIEDLDPGSFCGDRSQTGEVFKDVLSQSEYFKNQAKKTMSKNVLITMVTKPGSVFLIPEIVERLRHCEGIVDGVEDAVFVLSREELETFLKKYSDGGILSDDSKVWSVYAKSSVEFSESGGAYWAKTNEAYKTRLVERKALAKQIRNDSNVSKPLCLGRETKKFSPAFSKLLFGFVRTKSKNASDWRFVFIFWNV